VLAGYASQATGIALADVLLGRVSPAGKLAVSWLAATWQLSTVELPLSKSVALVWTVGPAETTGTLMLAPGATGSTASWMLQKQEHLLELRLQEKRLRCQRHCSKRRHDLESLCHPNGSIFFRMDRLIQIEFDILTTGQ
jgi:hypothetical protein